MKQIHYKPKQKICKQCGKEFRPYTPLTIVCSPNCAYEWNQENNVKKRVKEMKKNLRDREWYLTALETVFNAYIRKRDVDLPCISCGTYKANKWDAGHFWAAGNYSFLRFNEDNVHKQCSANCNGFKSGNQNEYRINLIKKIGAERVQWLDDHRHDKLDLTISEIKILITKYKTKIK